MSDSSHADIDNGGPVATVIEPAPDESTPAPAPTGEPESRRSAARRGGGPLAAITRFFAKAEPKSTAPKTPKPPRTARTGRSARTPQSGIRYRGGARQQFLRSLVIGLLLLTSLVALAAALSRPTKASIDAQIKAALTESGANFPTGEAAAWATQVVRVWGTWNADTLSAREVLLAPYLSSGMDPQAGWDGRGQQTVLFVATNPDPRVYDKNRATVFASYQIGDGTWRCVGVPVYAYRSDQFGADAPWAFALAANPTPVPCAPRTGAPKIAAVEDGANNAAAADTLRTSFYPGFMAAWAASDVNALRQYTDSGVQTMGLGGAMASIPPPVIDAVLLFTPKGANPVDGVDYRSYVEVTWTMASGVGQVSAAYTVPVKLVGARWVVTGEPVPVRQAVGVQGARPVTVPAPNDGATGTGLYPTPTTTAAATPAGAATSGSTTPKKGTVSTSP